VQQKSNIRAQLCVPPPAPEYYIIYNTDSEKTKIKKLLDNITMLKSYSEKLRAVIDCLTTDPEKDIKETKAGS